MDKLKVLKTKAEIANLKRIADTLEEGSMKKSLLDRAESLHKVISEDSPDT